MLGIPAALEVFITGAFSLTWDLETEACYQCICCMQHVPFCWQCKQNEVLCVLREIVVKCLKKKKIPNQQPTGQSKVLPA